ncbi:MAG: hypothetical protein NXI10_00225 [bacterium]|nr:hypothetical protein [bacterium]
MKLFVLIVIATLTTYSAFAQKYNEGDTIPSRYKTYLVENTGVKIYFDTLVNVQNDNVYRDGPNGHRFKNNLIRSVVFCGVYKTRVKDEQTGENDKKESIRFHQCISWDKGKLISKENKVKVYEAILGTDTSVNLTKDFHLYELLFYDSTKNIFILNTASTPTSNGGYASIFAPGYIENIIFIKGDKLVGFRPLYKTKKDRNTLEWVKSQCSEIPELDQFFEDIEKIKNLSGPNKIHVAKVDCARNLFQLYWNNYYVEL